MLSGTSCPPCSKVTAETEDGVIMGVRNRELPMEAVQFHPESILTLDGKCGLKLMENVCACWVARGPEPALARRTGAYSICPIRVRSAIMELRMDFQPSDFVFLP